MSEEKKEMKKSSSPAKDLTVGSPMKLILGFAFPMFLGLLFQQFYSLVDTMIVGKYLGVDPFAGVGSTGSLNFIVIGFCMGLCSGFSVPISQSFGAKDFRMLRKMVTNSVWLCVFFSAIFTTLMLVFCRPVLTLMNTPENIFEYAYIYIFIIFAGIPCTILYNMTAAILRALGDSKSPIIFLAISSAINIGLDLLFVNGFHMGIQGAAWATIISQALSAVLCLGYILLKFRDIIPEKDEWKPVEGQYSELLTTGLAMGFMSLVVNFGTIVLQGAINGLGTAIVAAHTAARKVFDIFTVSLYCLGNAMTTFVSQNMGAGEPARIRRGIRHAVVIATGITTVLVIICFAFGRPVFTWLASTDNPTIVDSAVMYSRISIVFFYVLGPLFILRCSLQGMGRKVIPVCSSVVEMTIKVLSATILVPRLAYFGVALTEPISWVCMTILLTVAYFAKPPEQMLRKSA